MVKQLVVAAMLLLIYDTSEAIQCAQAIFDFTRLAQYVLYDNETLRYMEHALYRVENTKIVFEHQQPIDSKLYLPTFNYPKFYAISHFVQCIWVYSSAITIILPIARRRINIFLKCSILKQTKRSTTRKFESIMYAISI